MQITKRTTACIVAGLLLAIPPSMAFESHDNIVIKTLTFWLLLGGGFSIFIVYFSNKPHERIKRGVKYAKWSFIVSCGILFLPLLSTLAGLAAVSNSTSYEFLQLLPGFLLYPIFLLFPFFLIGYFRAPREEVESES